MKLTDVAVVIVTYNSENEIEDCLTSLISERREISQQIVIVDNSPNDITASLVKEQFPEVKLILPGKNLGFAAGVNLGVKNSEAEFVLLLNPDTTIKKHAVDTIVKFARDNPKYGLYGGRTLKPDGTLEPSSCWGTPTLWSLFLFGFGFTTLAPRNPWLDPESLGSWQRDTVREVGVITGCFLLAPRLVWDELGGLDERYFMYGEDADLSVKARKAGYRPVVCPDAELVHEVGKSSDTPVSKTLLLYRGKATLVRSHWNGLSRWLGLSFLVTGAGIRAFISRIVCLLKNGDLENKKRWRVVWSERSQWIQGY